MNENEVEVVEEKTVNIIDLFRREHNFEYEELFEGYKHIKSCDGHTIHGDKHLYVCPVCNKWYQSKNIHVRSAFAIYEHNEKLTPSMREHECKSFVRVCKCEPVI